MAEREAAATDLDPERPEGGFADLVGYRLLNWQEDLAEVGLAIDKRHVNRQGRLHGGVLSTVLDAALGYSGCYIADPERRRRALTLSLTTHFVGGAAEGEDLVVRALRSGGGRSVFFATAEARTADGRLVATAEGVFKYRGRSGEPEGEPRG